MGSKPLITAFTALLIAATAASRADFAQQVNVGEVTVTPVSDLRNDWLNAVAESPTGRFVLVDSYVGDSLLRYDRVTKAWLRSPEILGSQARWSPDGKFVAFPRYGPGGIAGRSIWILPMDSATGVPRGAARRVSMRPASWPVWSPDSRRIAMSVQDSGRFRVVITPFNGGDGEVVYDAPGMGGDLAWSPDGKTIWAGHGRDPSRPEHYLRINVSTKRADSLPFGAVRMLGYSRDGSRVAHFDGPSATLVISSAATGRIIQYLRIPRTISLVGWSRTADNEMTALEHVTPTRVERVAFMGGAIQSISPADSAPNENVRFSRDGQHIAYVRTIRGVGRLHVADADGANLRAVGALVDISAFVWSPSGTQIAYKTDGAVPTIRVVDVASGADRELVRPRQAGAELGFDIAWRNDGRAVRYVWRPKGRFGTERELREIALDGTDRLLSAPAGSEGEPHFINDTLLLLRKGTGIDAVDVRTGAVRALYTGTIRARNEFGVSQDGKWIVVSADGSTHDVPRLISLATGETRVVPYALEGELGTIYFHPDGRNLVATACLSCNAGVEKWDTVVIPMNGDPPRVLTASHATYKDHGSPAISPDGRYVVFASEKSYNTRIVTLTLPKAP